MTKNTKNIPNKQIKNKNSQDFDNKSNEDKYMDLDAK